jgi:hypothetical protein
VHPDLLNSRFGYISISRASHEATLFTDDIAKLSPHLSADASKTSALEISQTPSTDQEIGMMWTRPTRFCRRCLANSFDIVARIHASKLTC